jgi:hypothetical protein
MMTAATTTARPVAPRPRLPASPHRGAERPANVLFLARNFFRR